MTDEQIISELGFATADATMQQSVVENVRAIVDARVVGLVSEKMTDEQLVEFERLQTTAEDAAVWEWLKTNVVGVDVSQVYEGILEDYIAEKKANSFKG